MNHFKRELIEEIEIKKKKIEASLLQLKVDSKGTINDKRNQLQQKLDKLEDKLSKAIKNFSQDVFDE